MDDVKQVIIIRKDLGMRKGKVAAQAAHASMKILLDRSNFEKHNEKSTFWEESYVWYFEVDEDEPMFRWLRGEFTKIVVYVKSEAELLEVYEKAKEAGLLASLITDAGKTEFHGDRTRTAVAVGPDWSSKIDKVTGHLPLL